VTTAMRMLLLVLLVAFSLYFGAKLEAVHRAQGLPTFSPQAFQAAAADVRQDFDRLLDVIALLS
jgi:hypothetical protein